MKIAFKFSLILFLVCLLGFGVHLGVKQILGYPLLSDGIILSYTGNFLLANFILLSLLFTPERFQQSRGFLFMFGSILKFGFFFLFFYSPYKADGNMSKSEFLTFFVPYSICLVVETKLLISSLSKE